MTDSVFRLPLGVPSMGDANSAPATPSSAPSVQPAVTPAVSISINDNSLRGSAGAGTAAPAIDAHDAEQQHIAIQRQLDTVTAKLAAHSFNSKTGERVPVITGRDRDVLELQRLTLQNAFQYQAALAVRELPKGADARANQNDAEVAAFNREAAISQVSEMRDNAGRPIGRVRAIEIVRRAEIDNLVGRTI